MQSARIEKGGKFHIRIVKRREIDLAHKRLGRLLLALGTDR